MKKEKTDLNTCPGFPGLETALPLLLTAVYQKRLTLDDIITRYYTNPRRIFNLPEQQNTFIEVDMMQHYKIPEETQMCKSKWTPFTGMNCVGAIKRVVLRGETVYISDKPFQGIITARNTGNNVRSIFDIDNLQQQQQQIQIDQTEQIRTRQIVVAIGFQP